MSIKNKFILVGLLLLFSMLSILGLGQYTLSQQKNFHRTENAIGHVRIDTLTLRRHEKDFLARLNLKYVERFKKNLNTLENDIEVLQTTLEIAGLDKTAVQILTDSLNNYKNSFLELVEMQKKIGLSPTTGLYGHLRTAVHKAEKKINTLNDQKLLADMLQLRRNEKDFMLRHKTKYLGKFENNMKKFLSDLDSSQHDSSTKENIHSLMKDYSNSFHTLTTLSKKKGLDSNQGLLGNMRKAAHIAENELDTLEEELQTTIKSEIGGLDQLAKTMNLIALALVAIVLGMVIWTALGILRPIQSMANSIIHATQENDLSMRTTIESNDEIGKTGDAFNKMLEKFQNILGNVSSSALQLSNATQELAVISEESSTGLQQQSSQTQQVMGSIHLMLDNVKNISENSSQAATAADETTQQANQGRQIVDSAIQSMNNMMQEVRQAGQVIQKLEQDSNNIGTVLDVIRGIAEQTNLLALNAAIEAARAGEQGRGFAVVADEVRTLASRTQESTQEIQTMIENLQSGTSAAVDVITSSNSKAEQGMNSISEAGHALETIVEGVNKIYGMNTQIVQSTVQQTAVAEEVEANIETINSVVAASNDNVSRIQVASEGLAELSTNLQQLVAQFKN